MKKPRILVFASGTPEGGGSGFQELFRASEIGELNAKIVGVVSNHKDGGVRRRAKALKVPFRHFPGPWDAKGYEWLAKDSHADFFALSGWLKKVEGLDPKTKFNSQTVFDINPGPLPAFGGPGMYGHHVHEAVMQAYQLGELTHSEVCMHFVTGEYDRGPVFFRIREKIRPDDTPETLGARVNKLEHAYQSAITKMVVSGQITWDGIHPESLVVPEGVSR